MTPGSPPPTPSVGTPNVSASSPQSTTPQNTVIPQNVGPQTLGPQTMGPQTSVGPTQPQTVTMANGNVTMVSMPAQAPVTVMQGWFFTSGKCLFTI